MQQIIQLTGKRSLILALGLFCMAGIFFSCGTSAGALADKKNYSDNNDEYRRKFEFKPDSAEKPIRYGYHYVVSTIPGSWRVRVYQPDLKIMTEEKHYSTAALTLLHGEYKSWWDDGSIREQGFYQYGRRHGIWLEKEPGQGKSSSGDYLNQRKSGLWTNLDTSGMVESVYTWEDGKKNGKFFLYNSAGDKISEGIYRNDTLISELVKVPRISKPYLKNCENNAITDVHDCTDAMLPQYVYSALKYPSQARKNKIEGGVVAQWDVATDGSVRNIRLPQSLSNEIKDEVIRVLKNMPEWKPALKDGVPVKWTMSLPINFSL
ncbi:MAG TPA: TonB family protein [Saprospiraceae bacterium]|nr:TonB family protein [Saprospiraceae bacterium]